MLSTAQRENKYNKSLFDCSLLCMFVAQRLLVGRYITKDENVSGNRGWGSKRTNQLST